MIDIAKKMTYICGKCKSISSVILKEGDSFVVEACRKCGGYKFYISKDEYVWPEY